MYILFPYWIDKLFSEENKIHRSLFEAGNVAGSATYKQSKTVWNCVVLWAQFFFFQIIQSWKQREFVYLVFWSKNKLVN